MRGTLHSEVPFIVGTGIIPAYAGNTLVDGLMQEGVRDHPRVCGEHDESMNPISVEEGSSPRMRGTLLVCHDGSFQYGIIPAYAGNTSEPSS